MFPRARARPGAEETPEDEEASLLQQRDLTLRSALDQIQQRRRRTPWHRSPPPPPRTPSPPPPVHLPQGGPLEALRQREWLLNLQEQQELQRLQAPTTPQQEEEGAPREEQLLFNGEPLPRGEEEEAAPSPPSPCSPRGTTRLRGGGGSRRGGWHPSYPHHHHREGTAHSHGQGPRPPPHTRTWQPPRSSDRQAGGSSSRPREDWQERAVPRSEQDEASMLARALELSRLDDARSCAAEAAEQPARRGPPGARRGCRGGRGGRAPCPQLVVGSINAQQPALEGGVSFDQWLSLCGRYMPLLAQGMVELQRTCATAHALALDGSPIPFPPPGWPHRPPPPTAALVAELTGSALRANHCGGQLTPRGGPLGRSARVSPCTSGAVSSSPGGLCPHIIGGYQVASGGSGDGAAGRASGGHKGQQPLSISAKRQQPAQPHHSHGRRSRRSSPRKKPAARC